MNVTDIRNILEAPYDRTVWKDFIKTQFTNNNLLANEDPLNLGKNDLYKECYPLGSYAVDKYTKIGIFEVQLTDKVNLTRNRVALRNLIKDITKQVAGAMVVFVQGDKWRFSYISKRKVKNTATDTIEDKETAPKRYTYLFGKNEKALTAAQRFDQLIQKQKENQPQSLTLNDFEEAFSVERLSKEFFNEYKKSYEDFVEFITGKRYVKKGNKFVEIVIHPANFQLRNLFGNDEKQARDFCKRMMGRIVFLYFIQKKGWIAVGKNNKWGDGNPDYLYDLFKKSKDKNNFYNTELVQLFFKTLNNPNSEEEKNTLRFPYLNGGLFDETQDKKYNQLILPADIFDNLFKTFNNFNFTVYEDAPDEQTVAVDPEMLGHIFENLLEDNKDKGAFYTPKDIVHYMCRESLHNYIFAYTNNEGSEDFQSRLKKYNDTYEVNLFSKDELKLIDRALEDVKVCDPAIGSGAFPMGLLHEIYHLKIPIEDAKGFKAKSPADIKKHIIEESIYGVDIEPGAVDIARLRFWLSLVVDENEPQPLPNLSFKIVCANTLIPLGKIKNLDMGGTHKIEEELSKVRHDYFNASMEKKTALENNFTSLQKKLLTTTKDWVTKEDAEVYQKLLEFSPFEESSCTWFDAWWMFGVKNGFDIVIGNPPYVGISKLPYKAQLQKVGYKTFESTGDLYSVFYEQGNQLLKENGILVYITSRQWLNASYGKSLRKYFIEKTNPLQLIDFGTAKIFDAATVFVNILIFEKSAYKSELKACQLKDEFKVENNDLGEYFLSHSSILNNLTENVWKIGEGEIEIINNEIEKNGVPLKDWKGLDFFRGITTGLNEVFYIDEDKKNQLINQDKKNAEIIKPLLRGKDIKRYGYEYHNLYMLNTHNGIREIGLKPIDVRKDYPTVYDYLLQFEDELRNRDDQGVHWSNLRNCAFLNEFEKEKIIWIEISDKANYTYDTNGMYLTNSAYFISGSNLKYILAILNSKTADFYFFQITAKIAGGRKRYTKQYVEQIPIPQIEVLEQKPFEILVDYLLYLHDKQSEQIFPHTSNERIASHIEDILNMMVYELYFEQHMKEVSIDVLQFIKPKPIANAKTNEEKAEIIKEFYLWLQTPDNAVRQRINIVDIKSPNILSKINLATQ